MCAGRTLFWLQSLRDMVATEDTSKDDWSTSNYRVLMFAVFSACTAAAPRRSFVRPSTAVVADFGALRIGISRRSLFFEPASYCAFLGTLPCTNEVGLFLARSAPSRRSG